MPVANIIEGVKKQGKPVEINNTSRYELPEYFKTLGFKVGAEIGVYKAEFTEKFCKAGFKMYGIDPWVIYRDYKNNKGQERLDFQYEHSRRVLEPYIKTGQCTLIRKMSMDALGDIPDESLDFVYIDGNHLLRYAVEDIVEWAKKVRRNGIISGHDYFRGAGTRTSNAVHVFQAVNAYVSAYFVPSFYVLGRFDKKKAIEFDEERDRWRSWFFFKDYWKEVVDITA